MILVLVGLVVDERAEKLWAGKGREFCASWGRETNEFALARCERANFNVYINTEAKHSLLSLLDTRCACALH